MTVEWVHTSSNTSGYILERRTDESSEWEVQEYGSAIREAAQENLTPRTIYHYRLKAWNEWGETEYVSTQTITSSRCAATGAF